MVLIQNNDSYDTYSWWYSYPKYIRGCPAGMVLIEADYTGTDENMPGLTSSQTGSDGMESVNLLAYMLDWLTLACIGEFETSTKLGEQWKNLGESCRKFAITYCLIVF